MMKKDQLYNMSLLAINYLSLSLSLFLSQEAIITGLLAETTYSVTVAAYTTKGDGARSKAKVVTTTGAGETCFIRVTV